MGYILSYGCILSVRGLSWGVKRQLQDMICFPVLFILLKGRGTSYLAQGISYLVGGIFICCPLTLYIPRTFHIPLSPSPLLLVHQCRAIQITEASKPFESEMLRRKYFFFNSCEILGGSAANFILFLTI